MRKALQDLLRAAWFGPLTFEQVADANNVSTRTLQRFWSGEKKAGVLPSTPRPHFVAFDHNANPAEPDPPAGEIDVDADLDGVEDVDGVSCLSRHAAPISSPWGLRLPEIDPALAAMRAHHASLDHSKHHTAPAHWLKRDRDPFYAPAHSELMAMARGYDQGER